MLPPLPPAAPNHHVRAWMQVFGSVMMLAATLWFVDLVEIWQRLRQLQAAWLVLTLGILVMQFVLLAARWWWFARRLSAPLSYPQALREYFLAGLLNQILPFGILGDVSRAIRHARQTRQEARTSTRARPMSGAYTSRAKSVKVARLRLTVRSQ